MDKILLDSDVIIEWLRGHQPFVEQIPKLIETHSELFWTPVSVAEVFAGVRKGEEDTRKAGAYLKAYAKSHSVELGDALIAACASSTDLKLWTLNKKHYPMKDIAFYK